MPDNGLVKIMHKNPALMAAISPMARVEAEVHPGAIDLITGMIADQSAIISQYERLGAPTAYATGARDGLIFALNALSAQ
jgi:hypothetical protein